MELNSVELALKELYDDWTLGNAKNNHGDYSAMFRMGFPKEYIGSKRPLLMYVGQECLRCTSQKTQIWVRNYQNVQRTKVPNKDETPNQSPFWEFYRSLCTLGFDSLWNNLDKLHLWDRKNVQNGLPGTVTLTREDAKALNAPYGPEGLSVLQREIQLLKPRMVLFAIGPQEKYRASLAAAFSVDERLLCSYKPTRKQCVRDISALLGLEDTVVLWTYHPKYLRIGKLEAVALTEISRA